MNTNNIISFIKSIIVTNLSYIIGDETQDGIPKEINIITNRLAPPTKFISLRIDSDSQELREENKMLTNSKYHLIIEVIDIAKLQYNEESVYDKLDKTFNNITDRIVQTLFNHIYDSKLAVDKTSINKVVTTVPGDELGMQETLFLCEISFYINEIIC